MSLIGLLSAKACLLVASGAAIGGVLRYGMGLLIQSIYPFALSTLMVNMLGGLLMGFGSALLQKSPSEGLRLFLLVGVLGGFTTFSSFSLESLKLLHEQAYTWFALHSLSHWGCSLLACALGWWLALVLSA